MLAESSGRCYDSRELAAMLCLLPCARTTVHSYACHFFSLCSAGLTPMKRHIVLQLEPNPQGSVAGSMDILLALSVTKYICCIAGGGVVGTGPAPISTGPQCCTEAGLCLSSASHW